MENEQKYEYDEVEVQLGESKEIRCFKKVTNFKQTASIGTIEFDYRDFDPENTKRNANGEIEFQYYTSHAELYGRVVSKIRRV